MSRTLNATPEELDKYTKDRNITEQLIEGILSFTSEKTLQGIYDLFERQ